MNMSTNRAPASLDARFMPRMFSSARAHPRRAARSPSEKFRRLRYGGMNAHRSGCPLIDTVNNPRSKLGLPAGEDDAEGVPTASLSWSAGVAELGASALAAA